MNTTFFKRFASLALLSPLLLPSLAHADSANPWSSWWLPKVYSVHGPAIDSLFTWIFWITTVTFVLVQVTLIVFLIKYRYNPNKKKAVFTHGNQRLEMCWTITPAIILLVLALASKRVWDNYRYSPIADDPSRVKLLVIGQQFKWNTIYPGPDGEFGRYLVFPKPTDTRWSDPRPLDQRKTPFMFPEGKDAVLGPAFLPYEKAVKAINNYNDQLNPLGKDFDDPAGKDDIADGALAREIVLPADRGIEVQVSSKDVIHDFFLPNYRVKLDAVPGMRGKVYFQCTTTSEQLEKPMTYNLDDLSKKLKSPELKDWVVKIDQKDSHAGFEVNKGTKLKQWSYMTLDSDRKPIVLVRENAPINQGVIDAMKAAGFKQVTLYQPFIWELVCEELCGQGHNTMRGQIRVVSNAEYDALNYDKPLGKSASAPAAAGVAMGKMP